MENLIPTMDENTDTRGQLFIIGAIALAITFVALTLLLNTAIYTENVAARGENVGGTGINKFMSETVENAEQSMARINKDTNKDATDLEREINHGWGPMVVERYGSQGILAQVWLEETEPGEYAAQVEERDFTNPYASDPENYRLIHDTPYTRDFMLHVDPAETNDEEEVTFDITFGGDFETNTVVTVRQGQFGDRVEVEVDGEVCEATTDDEGSPDHVTVDITSGEVGGQHCTPLTNVFEDDELSLGEHYHVNFNDAQAISGTWEINVPEEGNVGWDSGLTNSYRPDFEDDSDYEIKDIVYSTTFDLSYSDQRDSYTNMLRVAPGEHER